MRRSRPSNTIWDVFEMQTKYLVRDALLSDGKPPRRSMGPGITIRHLFSGQEVGFGPSRKVAVLVEHRVECVRILCNALLESVEDSGH